MLRAFAALLMLGMLLGGGCESRPREVVRGTVRLTLSAEKKVNEFTLASERLLELTLPATGPEFRWEISFHDPRYLRLKKEIATAATGTTVAFLAIASGRTRLRFVLLPAKHDRTLDPVDQQEVILSIQ